MIKKYFILILIIHLFTGAYSQYGKLPHWVKNIPKSSRSVIYAVGISDTKLNEKKAYEQATNRAKIIVSLLKDATVMQSKDYFTVSRNDMSCQKMERLAKIVSTNIFDTLSISVVKKEYNLHQEAIVLIKYTLDDNSISKTDSVKVYCDSYLQEVGIGNGFDFIRSFKMNSSIKSKTDSITLKYDCYDNNNEVSFTVEYCDSAYKMPGTVYEYRNTKNKSDISNVDYQGVSSLKKGLWKAYLDDILQGILNNSNLTESKTKNSADLYSNESNNYKDKNEKLSREISSNHLSFNIRNIDIVDNKLLLNLNLVSEKEKSWFSKLFNK